MINSSRNNQEVEDTVRTDCTYVRRSNVNLVERNNSFTQMEYQSKGETSLDSGFSHLVHQQACNLNSIVPDELGTKGCVNDLNAATSAYPTDNLAESRKIYQPPVPDYSSCIQKIEEQLPYRLQEFFESVKDSELDDMLEDISDIQLKKPLPYPASEFVQGSPSAATSSTGRVHNFPPVDNSSMPFCKQTSRSQANCFAPPNIHHQNLRNGAFMYQQVTENLRQYNTHPYPKVYPHCPGYPQNVQTFAENQTCPINTQPARFETYTRTYPGQAFLPNNTTQTVQKKSQKTPQHLPIPEAPVPNWYFPHRPNYAHYGYNHQGHN